MSAFDTLEQQLRDATRRRYGRRLAWKLAPAVALAAAALTTFTLVRDRAPIGADEREAPAVQPAPTWTPDLGDHGPSISRSPVPPEQAAAFAILRRPQTEADRSPAVRKALKRIGGVSGVRVDAIRVLETRRGEVTILLPVRRLHPVPHDRGYDPLCLVQSGAKGVGMTCGTFEDVRRGRTRWPIPPRGMAPDGAASVKVRVRGGKTVTIPVRDNFYDARWAGAGSSVGIAIPRYFDARDHEIKFR